VVLNTIKIEDGSPLYASVNPKTGLLYLSYPLSDFVLVVNTNSKQAEAKIELNFPRYIAVNSNSGKVYVHCADGIYVIDSIHSTVIGAIKNTKNAVSGRTAINERDNIIYTTCLGADDSVTVIDGSKDSIITKVKSGGKNPNGIAYDKNSNKVFVVNSKSNSISIIDSVSNELTDTFKIKMPAEHFGYSAEKGPEAVLVNSDLKLLYIKMRQDIVIPAGVGIMSPEAALCVIDLDTRKAINQRNLGFLDEEGIAFNPVTNSLYARVPKNIVVKFDAYGKKVDSY
jgi:YVTN family beta-propeller protein